MAAFTSGWRAVSLPLSSANDDPTAPFPVVGLSSPAQVVDTLPSAGPLILYRALAQPGDMPIAGIMLVAKRPAGVAISF